MGASALAACRDDPVIPEPEVQGPIPVEGGLQLMAIATSSLLEAVTRVTGGEARTELSRLISRHLDDLPAASLSTVAQATSTTLCGWSLNRQRLIVGLALFVGRT